jgi:transcriptional regulator with XRE-family HTH domain
MVISMNLKLQDIRENNELSQKAVADILNVSQPTYSRWEKEIEIIPLNKLILFAKYFNVSLDYLCNLSLIKKENKNYNYIVNKELSSNNIINFRKKNNLTQKELAIFLNTTPSTICAYEKGKTLILTSFAYQICKKYNISMDYICGLVK